MEPDSNNHYLVPFVEHNSLLPVVTPGRTLEIPAPKKSRLAKIASWVAEHPAARLGLATVAFAAGTYLSRRMPGERSQIPSGIQRKYVETEEWFVTGVGLSIQSDCQQVSIWSITRINSHR